ncbi:MAG: hypothetical protein AUK44_03725 [Porphyromonadaceae bacterium CG2_30_38_12]|nr:MAG: hypothetical protein AUK44_03725 [Porphyromonadaceae bacterium CG2_30_38_12]
MKSLFLSATEKTRLINAPSTSPTAALLSAMQARVNQRALSPSFSDKSATTEWWHHAAEYLTDAALIHAVRPNDKVNAWLHEAVMGIVRRPVADWAGPRFRGYGGGDMVGSLETGHLAWAISIAYDLSQDLYSESEKAEIFTALREKGQIPCRRYLDRSDFFHNWNCVLYAGYTVSSAILGDEKALHYAASWLPLAADHFQKDGSYGESLQYANYAAYSLMLAHEALLRYRPTMKTTFEPYGRIVNWASTAFFFRKALAGWSLMDWPRSANFGDGAAIFRPSGDLLVHIAARAKAEKPVQAGLATWLFNSLYFPANEPGPHDLASFGMVNGFGFLSVIMLADAAKPISPKEANLPTTTSFSGGDAFIRSSWDASTILATRMPAEPRHASAHLHGDINSFILVHNKQRLLVDPGHSCYRDITHELEASTSTHNTCTFEVPATSTSPARVINQRGGINRPIKMVNGVQQGAAPIDLGGKRLIVSRVGNVSVIGADAAQLYGAPMKSYARFFIQCGENALFIVDKIESEVPVKTTWNFLLNNQDGTLDFEMNRPVSLIARKGDAGVKIFNYGKANLNGPVYALVHDAYHPLPAQRGEGKPGSGMLMRWTEQTASTSRTVVNALAIDSHGAILGWESKTENNEYTLSSKDRNQNWTLTMTEIGSYSINDTVTGQSYTLGSNAEGVWGLYANVTAVKKKK